MRRICALMVCFFAVTVILAAQDYEQDPSVNEQETEDFVYKMNQKGDWVVRLGGALNVPFAPKNLELGMDFNLGFYTFLTENIAVGGDGNVSYTTTVGDNIYFSVPLMGRFIYQFSVKDFEIPVSLGVGIAIQTYIERYYFGLILNPEIGAFYRFRSDWSAGIHCGLNIVPQWYQNTAFNRTGLILDTGLSVRYHF